MYVCMYVCMYIYIFLKAIIAIMCDYFPKLLKTHFFIVQASSVQQEEASEMAAKYFHNKKKKNIYIYIYIYIYYNLYKRVFTTDPLRPLFTFLWLSGREMS